MVSNLNLKLAHIFGHVSKLSLYKYGCNTHAYILLDLNLKLDKVIDNVAN